MVFLLVIFLLAQDYTQRGFLETQFTLYPQKASNDSVRAVGDELFRYEAFYKPAANLEIAGAVDLRMDTHHQVQREFHFSWQDRESQRPAVALRDLRALYSRRGLTVEAGKQFVRWGKTDIVTPSDRFAPRDFLTVVNNDFLAISAIRATLERGDNTIDVVWSPHFTPSRIPLENQRWFNGPAIPTSNEFPNSNEVGFRFSHAGLFEYAFAFYSGFNHAPSFELQTPAALKRFYPAIRAFTADAAVPLRWMTLKLEAAHFHSPDSQSDDYLQYVIQMERQMGEWSFVGGYAGETIMQRGVAIASFDPDRGMTRTMIGRADYTIDANRSIAAEAALRQNGRGSWTKFEFSQAFGQHWRATTGVGLIRGKPSDFLGQYRRNSHGLLVLRYSF